MRFNATANFGGVSKEAIALNSELERLRASMASFDVSSLAPAQNMFRSMLKESIAFRTDTVKSRGAIQGFTEDLSKHEVTWNRLRKSRGMMNDVLKEQYRLQKMTSVAWSEDANGMVKSDIIIPKDVPARIGNFSKTLSEAKAGTITWKAALTESRMSMGLWATGVQSASQNLIKWGKNTQWAGRQLLVGMTVPFIALAAAAGKASFDVDKELTRITKVYDFTDAQMATSATKAAASQQLRANAMETATTAAQQYGQAAKDTLDVEAELAATGLKGLDLQKQTLAVQRASMLGEMSAQQTTKVTIALGQVFHQTADEINDSFNYMNSIENSTSLTMQDFADAIPRVSQVLSGLGGTVQDLGTLLVAMKVAGVDASVGANAVKSSVGSLLRPTAAARKEFAKFNISITDIVNKNKGDILKSFIDLSAQMEQAGMTNIQKQSAMFALFGKQQASRLSGLVQSLGQVDKKGSQVATAMKIATDGTTAWAKTAEGEISTLQQSASQKFKVALASIQVQLAKAGTPFLEIATKFLGIVGSVIEKFNGLSDGTKKFLIVGAAIAALVGPAIMITGILANFWGQINNLGAGLVRLASRFGLVTSEQMAEKLAAQKATDMFKNEDYAAKALQETLVSLTATMQDVAMTQQNLRITQAGYSPAPAVGTLVQGPSMNGIPTKPYTSGISETNGRYYRTAQIPEANAGNKVRVTNAAAAEAEEKARQLNVTRQAALNAKLTQTAALQAGVTESTEAEVVAGRKVNVGLLSSISMIGLLVGGSNKWVQRISLIGVMLPLILTTFKAIAATNAWMTISTNAKVAMSIVGSSVTKVLPSVEGLKTRMGSAATALLPSMPIIAGVGVALLAAGGAALYLRNRAKQANEEFKSLTTAAETAAQAMGIAYEKGGNSAASAGEKAVEANKKIVDSLKTPLKVIGNMFDKGQDAQAISEIRQIGIDFYLNTKDAGKANELMQIMLKALNKEALTQDVLINFQTDTGNTIVDDLKKQMSNISDTNWGDSRVQSIGGSNTDISDKAKTEADKQGKQIGEYIIQGLANGDTKGVKAFMDKIKEAAAKDAATSFKWSGNKDQEAQFQTVFGFSPKDTTAIGNAIIKDKKAFYEKLKQVDGGYSAGNAPGINDDAVSQAARDRIIQSILKTAGVAPDAAKKVHTFDDALALIATLVPVDPQVADSISSTGDAAATAGAAAITSLSDWKLFGSGVEAIGSDLGTTAADVAAAFTGAQKEAMGNAWGKVLDHASDEMDAAHTRNMDAMKARQDAAMNALDKAADAHKARQARADKLWDTAWNNRMAARTKYWDDQKKAVDNQIKAEEDAEKKRQAIFEAEKTRIERMAEIFNRNVDFNVALDTGNLDEAAKIQNDAAGQEQTWAVEDASAGSADASAQKIDALNKRKDSLDAAEKLEQDALDKQKAREKEARDATAARYDQSVTDAKAAADKRNKIETDSAERTYKAHKDALDMELAALREFIPKDGNELKAYVADIESTYNAHGMHLNTKSKEWAAYTDRAIQSSIAASGQKLETGVKWADIGKHAADDISNAIMGMNFSQFNTWMLTGKLPDVPASSAAPGGSNHIKYPAGDPRAAAHSGGHIGSSSFRSDRLGRTGNLYGDEVPAILQKGEYVIDKTTVGKFGADYFRAHQQGKVGMDETGRMHEGGTVGGGVRSAVAASIYKNVHDMLGVSMMTGAMRKSRALAAKGMTNKIPAPLQAMFGSFGSDGKPGKFAGTELTAQQLANASAILNVGRSMGATDRDLVVSLMTALQESNLVNLSGGDRDSVGLFQQRPSQGWGSVEEIMNPAYAARKFFQQLLKIKDRDKMALTAEAQAVQHSGFPMAYAKWEPVARSIIGGMGASTGAVKGGWGNPDAPGYASANIVRMGTAGLSWMQNKLAGNRFVGLVNALIEQGYRPQTVQGYNNRNIAGSDRKSNHAYGAAIDIDPSRNPRYASGKGGPYALPINSAQIASAFGLNWGGTYKSSKDYMHFEVLGSPSLNVGGTIKYDNTIANLHKDEKVLTAPLSKKLERGINNFDAGSGGDSYLFNFDGATFAKEIDVERAITKVLNARDSRVGRNRTVGK